MDNQNVRQAGLNSGSVRDTWLGKRVTPLQIGLHEQNTLVIPVYIRSAEHLHADLISRNKVMPDWHLDRGITKRLILMLGHPQVDLMATTDSKQVD